MKTIIHLLVLGAITITVHAGDLSNAAGYRQGCVAGSLLYSAGVPCRVVVFHLLDHDQAACVYRADGISYLYTPLGSVKVDADEVHKMPSVTVSRHKVMEQADGDRDIPNGCLVNATCAYWRYKRSPEVAWAGIIATRVMRADTVNSCANGHAVAAFETTKREVFIQDDDGSVRKLDDMTHKAQSGNKAWHDSAALIYCDHHIQGTSKFAAEYGSPL